MLRLHDDSPRGPRHDGLPALIASAPVLALLDELAVAVEQLEELTPDSPAIGVYRRIYERLWSSVEEAAERTVWISTDEAARRMDVSQSHVQHLCTREPDERPFHARKVGGVWRIDAQSLAGRAEAA